MVWVRMILNPPPEPQTKFSPHLLSAELAVVERTEQNWGSQALPHSPSSHRFSLDRHLPSKGSSRRELVSRSLTECRYMALFSMRPLLGDQGELTGSQGPGPTLT